MATIATITGMTPGKPVIGHSFKPPLGVIPMVAALVGIAIGAVFP
jgi:hypothetical protein